MEKSYKLKWYNFTFIFLDAFSSSLSSHVTILLRAAVYVVWVVVEVKRGEGKVR